MGVVTKYLIPRDTHMVKCTRQVENWHPIKHMRLGFISQWLWQVVLSWLLLQTILGQEYLHKVLINNYVTKSMVPRGTLQASLDKCVGQVIACLIRWLPVLHRRCPDWDARAPACLNQTHHSSSCTWPRSSWEAAVSATTASWGSGACQKDKPSGIVCVLENNFWLQQAAGGLKRWTLWSPEEIWVLWQLYLISRQSLSM